MSDVQGHLLSSTVLGLACLMFYAIVLLSNPGQPVRPITHASHSTAPIPVIRTRSDLPAIVSAEGFRTGAELGVQRGEFSRSLLSKWPDVTRFHLVDLWAYQHNYVDLANVDNSTQEDNYQATRLNLAAWDAKKILRWHRSSTKDAAPLIAAEGKLDFIYVDARHDYCGLYEDLELYWPLLMPGGLMAGHDYATADEVKRDNPSQDWSLCHNGSRHPLAVKGAVDDFFMHNRRAQVVVCYREALWNTWMVRKPIIE